MQLFIVRHANSDFINDSDHKRPLSELGMIQATQSADFLKQKIQCTDVHIISSDALRTATTASIIQRHIDAKKLTLNNKYYNAHVGHWTDAIITNKTVKNVILVGHNPTMNALSRHLNPLFSQRFSPSCVAYFELEIKPDGLKLPAQLKEFFIPDAI